MQNVYKPVVKVVMSSVTIWPGFYDIGSDLPECAPWPLRAAVSQIIYDLWGCRADWIEEYRVRAFVINKDIDQQYAELVAVKQLNTRNLVINIGVFGAILLVRIRNCHSASLPRLRTSIYRISL